MQIKQILDPKWQPLVEAGLIETNSDRGSSYGSDNNEVRLSRKGFDFVIDILIDANKVALDTEAARIIAERAAQK